VPRRIGAYLVEGRRCRLEEVEQALAEQSVRMRLNDYKPLGEILIEHGHLSEYDLQRALEKQRLEVLATVSVFRNLPLQSLRQISELAEQESHPKKTLLIRQGEAGDSFCVVISGRVRVFRTSEAGQEMTLTTLGPGEGFGEMALLAGEARSASVETIEPSSLLFLSRESFFALCKTNADLSLAFVKVLCDRLAQGNVRLELLSEEELAVRNLFGKYITPEIRDEILSGRVPLDGEFKEVTVLFADLRDFTALAEVTPPKEIIRLLNGYFTEMASAVRQHKGLVLQYIGDEIEAVFGAPLPLEDHPRLAVEAALEMRRRLALVNGDIQRQGRPPLAHGIGIHTGQALAANIGSPERMAYALIGDTVNLASRLQALNKQFGTDIIVSKTTRDRVEADLPFVQLPNALIRGKTEEVEIFSLG